MFWGFLMLLGFALGGTLERGAAFGIPVVLLGVPVVLVTIAWLVAPKR